MRALPALTPQRLSIVLTFVLGVTLLLAATGLGRPATKVVSCSILPNGRVPWISVFLRECPMEPRTRVHSVTVDGRVWVPPFSQVSAAVDAGGLALAQTDRGTFEILLVHEESKDRTWRLGLSFLICFVPVLWMVRVQSDTLAAPVTGAFVLTALVGVVISGQFSGGSHPQLPMISEFARGMIPGALWHLALSFPRLRGDPEPPPWLILLGYAVAAGIAIPLALTTTAHAAIWGVADRATNAINVIVGLLLVVGASRMIWAEQGAIDRLRAFMLAMGLCASLAATALLWSGAAPRIGIRPTDLMVGIWVVFALPLQFSVVRYHAMESPQNLRSGWVVLVYGITVASGTALALSVLENFLQVSTPASWLVGGVAGALLGLVVLEPTRRLTMDRASARRETVAAYHSGLTRHLPASVTEIAPRTADALNEGIGPRGLAVFVQDPDGLRLATARGTGAGSGCDLSALDAIRQSGKTIAHLEGAGVQEWPALSALAREGVSVVALAVDGPLGVYTTLAQKVSRAQYSKSELQFIEEVLAETLQVLRNAERAGDRAESARAEAFRSLAVGIAHDLISPLWVIRSHAEAMEELGGQEAPVVWRASRIRDVAGNLISMVKETVDEAKEEGKAQHRAARLEELIARAIHTASLVGDPDSIAVSIDPEIPPVRTPGRLIRILVNLLDNAAAAESGPIRIRASREHAWLVVTVIDTGKGMTKFEVAHAFEPMFTTRAKEGGSGVGLTVCRQLAQEIGGHVELVSTRGRGTEARVSLPLETTCVS